MKRNSVVRTETILVRQFIVFSLLAVLMLYIALFLFGWLFDRFILNKTQSLFFEEAKGGSIPEMLKEKIEAVNGWFVVLDKSFNSIDNANFHGNASFDAKDMSMLASGEYSYEGLAYYGLFSTYINGGEECLLIVGIPADNIKLTYTIANIPGTQALIFIALFLVALAAFIIGYATILKLMSKRLHNRIVSPILAITEALEALEAEDYSTMLDFNAQNEFLYINNAFNHMLKRLHDAENERKEQQQEKIKLLSDIGHDLRTPVTIIKGLLQALLSGKTTSGKTERQYLETIYRNTRTLSELIELQLDYALWERDDYQIVLDRNDICECVRDVIISNYALFDDSGAALSISIPEEDIFCDMNKGQLSRAFNNILTNAIFHNAGVIGLKIGVEISLASKNLVQVFFADSGYEMPENIKNSILSANGPNEKAAIEINHGLGLSIAQKIVEQHGGAIKLIDNWNGYVKAILVELPISHEE